MSAKNRIIQAAITLFNEKGTAHVSTNHIAEAAGVSPGNLYYHFQDKAHIIRAIYEQMVDAWEPTYKYAENNMDSITVLEQFIAANLTLLWQYRFFYREQVALLRQDDALTERHTATIKRLMARQRDLLFKASKGNIVHTVQANDLMVVAWITANHYLIYLESLGQDVHDADFYGGVRLVMAVLKPLLQSPGG